VYKIPANEPMLNAPNNFVHGQLLITAVQQFVVPDGVYLVWVSLTDAGVTGTNGTVGGAAGAGGAAGNWCMSQAVQVTPGMVILCSPGLTSAATTTFGNVSITKSTGQPGDANLIGTGGRGGSNPFGTGGYSGFNTGTAGGQAYGYGGGGGGGGSDGVATAGAGGAFAPGMILVEW
jgi:hypothetical protein